MALLKGEGTHQILYGAADIFSGLRHNRGYLARPDHAGSFPAVLVAHGLAGLTSSVKSVARRLARYGLAVVVPDLYRGSRLLKQPLPPWPEDRSLLADLRDGMTWMASSDTPWIRTGEVGVLGIDAACRAAQIHAGRSEMVGGLALVAPTSAENDPEPVVPTLAFYGKEDAVVPEEERAAIQRNIDHAEWVLYGGAGHGLIDESAEEYRWEVAEDVLDRIVEFFNRTLAD